MAKLKEAPITKEDIITYLDGSSDFSFEIQVLRCLSLFGFECEHSGTYEDPITKKTREYDIRARKCLLLDDDIKLNLSLSIECKNLKDNSPLVIHCMPRKVDECHIDLVWSDYGKYTSNRSIRVPLYNEDTPYVKQGVVGKSCDQVGKKLNGELTGNDGGVFEKISQAINSAYDLIYEANTKTDTERYVVTLVVPMLVVPNDRIWTVRYKKTGEVEEEPTNKGNVEYYIDKKWVARDSEGIDSHYLSHLEIVQIDMINEVIEKYTNMPLLNSPKELIRRYLKTLK